MKKIIFAALILCVWGMKEHQAQTIVSVSHLKHYTLAELQAAQSSLTFSYAVDAYHVIYNTNDPHGNPTTASGALFVPVGCDSLPLLSYQHGTVLHKDNVPSRLNDVIGAYIAGIGLVVTAADYLGLGDGPGSHPYVHGASEATASIDLMRAGRTYVTDTLSLNFNDEVYLTGYSQGGHATMAIHKYIEENNLLSEFDIRGSAPLAGPYNMSGIQTQLAPDSTYSVAAYLPYLINSYQTVYGNLYNSLSDIYKPPYDAIIPPFLDGTHTLGEFNDTLPNNVYHFLQDSFLNAFVADTVIETATTPFRLALIDNDNHDWLPTRPIRMYYCEGDEQVFYENAIVALNTMTTNGATDVQAIGGFPLFDHSGCAPFAFLSTLNWLRTLVTFCNVTVGTAPKIMDDAILAFPSPTKDWIRLDLSLMESVEPLQLKIYNMNGQELLNETFVNQLEMDISLKRFGQGMYIIHIFNDAVQARKKVMVY